MEEIHLPVLLEEVISWLAPVDGGIYVDGNLGLGGHSAAILEKSSPTGRVIGFDWDRDAIDLARANLASFGSRITFVRRNFVRVKNVLGEQGIEGVNGLLLDLGLSSLQLDRPERGFSFREKGFLDMRMDASAPLSAYEVVNDYSKEKLEYIFDTYGEIRSYRKMAAAIIEVRSKAPIQSAKALAEIAKKIIPSGGKIHPATLMFQAIRIEVNNELGEIEGLLDSIEFRHFKGEVVSLITFHSLEDRLVKNRFKKWSSACICDPHAMRCTCGKNHDMGKALSRKPVTASKEELKINPRSRSAKLRSFKFKNSSGEN